MELKDRLSLILILLTNGFCLASVAQTPVFFTNESHLIENNLSSGIAVAVADVNNDYRDDLIRISELELIVHAQLNQGRLIKEQYRFALPFDVTTINVGNINALGANDIFISGFKKGFVSIEMDTGFENYRIIQESSGSYYAQGSSINDINLDGKLDVLVTNDIGFNQAFVNDGQGQLILDEDIIDFKLNTEEESKGNYNSIWFDADQDNDLDLFISKCFVTATTVTDLRRINQLFINEDGEYIEKAKEFGLAHGEQTWCADSGDLDNDGDIDLVIINHGAPSMILENNGQDSFLTHDVFSSNGMIISEDLQVTLADYNNDGLIDICIAGTKSQILLNKGNLQFEAFTNAFGFGNMTSMATGDLNEDGWLDLIGVYGEAGSDLADRLHANIGGTNNSVTLSLEGIESNANGIGSKVEIYHKAMKQVRWLNSGVSYGITNSLNLHFGLNDAEIIDSLICYWPSGNIDKHYGVSVNTHYIIFEGQCIEPVLIMETSNDFIDCKNEEIILSSLSTEEIVVNDSLLGADIIINQPGYYSAEGISSCSSISSVFYIDTLEALIKPVLTFDGDLSLCENDDFICSTLGHQNWNWTKDGSDFDFANEIIISESGTYLASTSNNCDTISSEPLFVDYYPLGISQRADTISEVSDVVLSISEGDLIEWYDSDQLFLSDQRDLQLHGIESDTLFYFKAISYPTAVAFNSFPDIDSFARSYVSNQLVGGLGFRVNGKCRLKALMVETDKVGERTFLIINSNNDTIFRHVVDLDLGQNKLFLDIVLDQGDYKITTDKSLNQVSFGHNSPRLSSADRSQVSFPISVNAYIDLEFSLSGLGDFSQFFNWDIEPFFEECISDFISYNIVIDTTVSNYNLVESNMTLYPNPTNHNIYWDSDKTWDRVELINVSGEVLYNREYALTDVNLYVLYVGHLSKGLYFLRFTEGGKIVVKKFGKL